MSDIAAIAELMVSAWPRADSRPLWQWAHEEVELPPCYAVSGRFSADRVPFICAPADALLAPSVRVVVCQSSVQSLKTLLGELWLLHSIVNAPGPTQWLQNTDDEAKEHAEERFNQLIDGCPAAKRMLSSNRWDRKISSINFRHMFLRMEGAENIRNLQRKSIKNQMCSEVWNWPSGRLSEAEARLTQFTFNSKRYIESQPGTAGDDMDLAYHAGDRNLWHVACESCGHLQPMRWTAMRADGSRAGIKWDSGAKRADGSWNLNMLEPSIRFECCKCGHGHVDDARTRRLLNLGGKFIPQNPDAPKSIRSFAWNQLTVENLTWFRQVQRWIEAVEQAGQGNDVKLREFMQKVLAEPYDPAKASPNDRQTTVAIDLTGDDPRWDGEKYRFLTVDVQDEHFWVLVTSWTERGDSLVWWFGKVTTWGEVSEIQRQWKVPTRCVFVDSGWNSREVYAECVNRGDWESKGEGERHWVTWRALKGDMRSEFTSAVRRNGRMVRVSRPYSWPPSRGDPMMGKKDFPTVGKINYCPLISWSNPTIKDIAASRRDGKAKGIKALVHEEVDKAFVQHMFAERRVRTFDTANRERWRWERIGKRPNHGWDCMCMAIVAACLARVIGSNREEEFPSVDISAG